MEELDMLTPDEWKKHLQSLLDLAKCPVCHNVPAASEAVQCVTGHVTCATCRAQIPHCPLCQSAFSADKPLFYCQVADCLPKFCRNDGCSKWLQDTDDHQKVCPFRKLLCLTCFNQNIKKYYLVTEILNHVQNEHSKSFVTGEFVDVFPLTMRGRVEKHLIKHTLDHLVWLTYIVTGEQFQLVVFANSLASQPANSAFFVDMTLENEKGAKVSLLKSLGSIHLASTPELEKVGTTFCDFIIPKGLLAELVTNDVTLKFKIGNFRAVDDRQSKNKAFDSDVKIDMKLLIVFIGSICVFYILGKIIMELF